MPEGSYLRLVLEAQTIKLGFAQYSLLGLTLFLLHIIVVSVYSYQL